MTSDVPAGRARGRGYPESLVRLRMRDMPERWARAPAFTRLAQARRNVNRSHRRADRPEGHKHVWRRGPALSVDPVDCVSPPENRSSGST